MQELTLREFTEAVESDPKIAKRFQDSHSPGPVAARLGITRQSLHELLRRGRIEACRLVHKDGSLAAVVIFDDSVRRYERERAARLARTAARR